MDVRSFLEEELEKFQASSLTSSHEDGGPKGVGGERVSALRKEEEGDFFEAILAGFHQWCVSISVSSLDVFSSL